MIYKVKDQLRSILQSTGFDLIRVPKPNYYKTNLGCIGKNSYIYREAIIKGHLSKIFIDDYVMVEKDATIECDSENLSIHIGKNTLIRQYAMILTSGGKIRIGSDCSVNPFCVLYGHGGLTIGNWVRIATHTVIVPANYIFDDLNIPIDLQGSTKEGVIIEDDVWIGAGVRILDGCKVGKGSVLGAGTVLTKSVEPYSVVVGVPGRVIRKRGK